MTVHADCFDRLTVGFIWIIQPLHNLDSGFTQSLYLRCNILKFKFLIRY